MRSIYPLQHLFLGTLLFLLGAFVLIGWITSSAVMVRVVPGGPAVSINTGIMFVLSGLCLLLVERRGWKEKLYLWSASALVLLSLAILSQHIFAIDLGIDLASIHRAVGDGHAKPGRTAPNACFGFLLAGLVFLLGRTGESRALYRRLSLSLSVFTLAIGVMSLLGYMLHLEAMYQLASYNRMALLTALGIAALGVGLWGLSINRSYVQDFTPLARARRITRLSAGLLTVFAIIAGLTGFAILRQGFEESSRNNLNNMAKTAAFVVSSELKHGILVSHSVVNRTILKRHLAQLQSLPDSSTVLLDLREVAQTLIGSGFSGIQLFDASNRLLLTEGEMRAENASFKVPVGSSQMTLFWQQGLVLRSDQPIVQSGAVVGRVVAEMPLANITEFMVEAQQAGTTNDVILCGKLADNALCFPSKFQKEVYQFPMFTVGGSPAMSVSRALSGESGAETTTGARGVLIQAGFAPLPDYGLGLIVKKDVLELYAPLRERLHVLIVVLAGFVAIGTLLLRQWVQPLVEHIALEQSRIKAILNNSSDAFIAVGSNGLVSDWNLQAERTLGWRADEAVGQDLAELVIPAAHRKAHNDGFAKFLFSGTGRVINQRLEVHALHKNGYQIPVELSVAAFHDGRGFGSSAFLRDLSDLKAAELKATEHAQELEAARAALVQSQKLEAVGKLTGGVAHDFNNVLQVVRGSLQLLQLEFATDAQADKRITTAMTAVDRGAKLSAQLLTFARKQPLQPQVVNLGRVIRSMGEMLQRALGDAIEVEIISAGGLWNTTVDPNQLENVILNLAINARDAMRGEGKLTIEVGNAILDEVYVQREPGLVSGQFVMLAISDTGEGMPEEVMAHAFEPFYTTKPEGEGTGLGLSMAHGFVKQSDGHIRIYSELGHGTTIKVYLPRCFEPEAKRKTVHHAEVEGGDETILVVEDDLAVQATVVDTLTGLGYKVRKADNAEAALEILLNEGHVDLLFTDVVMPGPLRSTELAQKAKELFPKIEVLFTSGYTRNSIVHGGRLEPGVHLLSKPYGRDQLALKVRELLGTARLEEPLAASNPETVTIEQDPPDTSNKEDGRDTLKVAFVEDNDDFRALVTEMVGMMGHRVESFASAEEALTRLERERFDVLVTDLTLPGLSGLELASIAHKADPQMGIVLASGYGGAIAEQVDFSFQTLPKPFSLEQLEACLRQSETAAGSGAT